MILLTLALAAVQAPTQVADWRTTITRADRARLRGWRAAWMSALRQVRVTHRAELARDPALYDPDRALPRPLPPAGDYRCRTIKLGAQGGGMLDYVAYPSFACRIARDDEGWRFTKLSGSQRPSGRLFPHGNARGVFLGTLALGEERRAMPYGRDPMRDMVGYIERIGERRWRLAFPSPTFEAMLDIIELTPP